MMAELIDLPGTQDFYPTPPAVVARMIEALDLGDSGGLRVLEPSAGIGTLAAALPETCDLTCVEIHPSLAARLRLALSMVSVWEVDFMRCTPDAFGLFDRVAMSPPFRGPSDFLHVQHASSFLAQGGRLVAVMTRRGAERAARELGGYAEDLPDDAYAAEFAPRPSPALTALYVLEKL